MQSSNRLKKGDAIRHIAGREGAVEEMSEDGVMVIWTTGQKEKRPVREGYLERIKAGLTSFSN